MRRKIPKAPSRDREGALRPCQRGGYGSSLKVSGMASTSFSSL